ncbi:T9SS type A sorting domain-containing protein [Spirosoma sp.]|uniref:T9SS type A sorting domain-containing protein n=1 Tax=Spirosoma sp. TaxID=1899569 RepID=UPI002605A9D6|nr:T9SS type A sorting domain-containing protein [Spirosoma sp.]MCX6217305.1 T9SS type A sorting domain-containing protein [Spirosoma sp.]
MKPLAFTYILSVIFTGCIYSIVCGQNTSANTCDYTITKSGLYKNGTMGVLPGQTVCIKAGTYTNLHFSDFVGTAEKPIRFINYGGKVIVSADKAPAGIQFYFSKYFILSGSGSSDLEYGILVEKTGTGGQAVRAENKSSDCEIDHIEIAGSGFAGIMVKTDPTCDSTTWRQNLVIRNVKVHHNYIHDTDSEGIYIGSSFWNEGYKMVCGGQTKLIYPHNIYGLEIHHNRIERTGTEGLQYAAAPDADVHHNIVSDPGLKPFAAFQNNGVQLGGGVGGNFYNNQIFNAPAVGLTIVGNGGNSQIYNNLIVNSKVNAIFCDNRPGTQANTPIVFANNTLIDSGEEAIKLYNETNNNLVINNIIAKVGKGRRYIMFAQGATAEMTSNFMTSDIDSAGFMNPAEGNFRLKNDSKLIDSGLSRTGSFVNLDLDNNRRPIGRQIDVGAYEYHPLTDRLITIYPSPCDDQLSLWSTELIRQVKIFTITGKQVFLLDSVPTETINVPVKALGAGLYVLQAETTSGSISKRFLKR